LLDASAQHACRTGREVLEVSARVMGLPMRRVDEMLELVRLTAAESKRRVRHYSLGMRQRLGIAHALLGDPSILILDEPANGLDPAGIHWMRGLLRNFAERGGTVLLSSHLLNEVEIIADEIILIGSGASSRTARRTTCSAAPAPSSKPRTLRPLRQRSDVPVLKRRGTMAASGWMPTQGRSAGSPPAPASRWSSCGPPTAPASRRCSSP
jgi:ABC-2 type transport system ATP-binding protein